MEHPSPPSDAERDTLFDDANGDLAVGDFEAAIAGYRRCIALDATFFDAWHALGMALMKQGHLGEAIGAALMATELKPNDLLAWTSLSQIYMKNGRIAEAESAKSNAAVLGLGGRIVK